MNLKFNEPTYKDSNKMAESEGFEPSMGYKTHTPLAGERLQPLGQLSVFYLILLRIIKHLYVMLRSQLEAPDSGHPALHPSDPLRGAKMIQSF